MILRIIALFLLLLFWAPIVNAKACSSDHAQLMWPNGKASFRIEVADTKAKRQRGLMFRKYMPPFSAMLFINEHPENANFWMRNTFIPLDMLFFDAAGILRSIHENAIPHDETIIHGGESIKYVLEVNAGIVKMLKIPIGARMRSLRMAQNEIDFLC